jgi:hypothetical protein
MGGFTHPFAIVVFLALISFTCSQKTIKFQRENPAGPRIAASRAMDTEETGEVAFKLETYTNEDDCKDASPNAPKMFSAAISATALDSQGKETQDKLDFIIDTVNPAELKDYFVLERKGPQKSKVGVVKPLDREELAKKFPDLQVKGEGFLITMMIRATPSEKNSEIEDQTIQYKVNSSIRQMISENRRNSNS